MYFDVGDVFRVSVEVLCVNACPLRQSHNFYRNILYIVQIFNFRNRTSKNGKWSQSNEDKNTSDVAL